MNESARISLSFLVLTGFLMMTGLTVLAKYQGGDAFTVPSVSIDGSKSEGFNFSDQTAVIKNNHTYFIENKGQVIDQYGATRTDIDFRIPGGEGLNIFISSAGIHYQWSKPINQSNAISGNHLSASNNPILYEMYRLDMELVGAKKPEAVIVDDRQPYYEWYYLPHCGPDGVKADAYHRVVYCEVYPNIDWVLYIKGTHLEYDFVIRPGGSVSDIQMQYKGAEEISILPNGNLCIKTPEGRVTEQAPYSFVSEGKEIHSSFHLNGDIVSFDVEAFAATETLVIDPVVQWATYYGGSDGDYRATVTCDTDGNVYMSGDAASRNNIATSGSHQSSAAGNLDAFLVKFNSDGIRQWATFLGGQDHDYSWQVTSDPQNNIYIVGQTYSVAGISTVGSHQVSHGGGLSDAYLVKFNSAGTRLWGTYYGGGITSNGNGVDYGYAVTCDQTGNVYIAGYTTSEMGIATPGAHQGSFAGGDGDAFIAKFNSTGVRQWGTYFGGGDEDQARSLSCDNSGNLYIAGYTLSNSNIASPSAHQTIHGGRYDGFLAKFNGVGVRQWSSYYGGSEIDRAYAIHWDESGMLYLAGDTYSGTSIATNGSHQPVTGNRQDAFLAKFNEQGVRQWGTYYGGSLDDEARAVTTNSTGSVFVAGFASSTSQIATTHGPQSTIGGSQDAFLVKFDAFGAREWATYYGGTGFDYGYSVTIDQDKIYLSGQSNSVTGIATPGSHQDGFGGGYYDNYLVRFNDCDPPPAQLSYQGDTMFCEGDTLWLHANTGKHRTWQWEFDGVDVPGANDSLFPATKSGLYTVTVYNGSCGTKSQGVEITVMPRPETPAARNNGPLCNGETLHLAAPSNGAVTWLWIGPNQFSSISRSPSIENMQEQNAGVYKVVTVHENGCYSDTGYTAVDVIRFSALINDTAVCDGDFGTLNGQVIAPDSFGGYNYEWVPATGLDNSFAQHPVITREPGKYVYYFIVESTSPIRCSSVDSAEITVLPGVVLTNVTEDRVINYGASVQLNAEGADYYIWSPGDYLNNAYLQRPVATPEETMEYVVEGFSNEGCSSKDTVLIEVDRTVKDFIPTAFTPNGDGKNDFFKVANLKTQKLLEFRVFNRYGEEVFATIDKTRGWDGTKNGEPQASGTYTYLIRMIYPDNPLKVITYTGSVLLIR